MFDGFLRNLLHYIPFRLKKNISFFDNNFLTSKKMKRILGDQKQELLALWKVRKKYFLRYLLAFKFFQNGESEIKNSRNIKKFQF